jgi:hypothetical protein
MGIFGTKRRDVLRAAEIYGTLPLDCDFLDRGRALFNLIQKIDECPAYMPGTEVDEVMEEFWASYEWD